MIKSSTQEAVNNIIYKLDQLVPVYNAILHDAFNEGHVAVCIIDEEGNVYGKIWGSNKARARQSSRIAWTKSTQVWITGMKTGEFEKKLFNGEIKDSFGIQVPDFIGWEGGQPITLGDGTKLSVGFSGFTGKSDLEIVLKAINS